jgi:hypothetical protein
METIAFHGASQEEAEERKEEWLLASPGVIVRDTRIVFAGGKPDRCTVFVYRCSIEVDYEISNSLRHSRPRLSHS